MKQYVIGARGHDYPRGTPKELFAHLKADGYHATQLAFLKAIEGVTGYSHITSELVAQTKVTAEDIGIHIPVLGTYVELALLDEVRHGTHVENFISQISVCKELGAGCIASETTSMTKQPVGATKKEAQRQLRKALEQILPVAEREDVIVALEPVWHHALDNTQTIKSVLSDMGSRHLKMLYDPANLLPKEHIFSQERFFAQAMQEWGEHIMAVHFKGVCYDEKGTKIPCPLEDSVIDYAAAFKEMKPLFNEKKLFVLREEAVPARAKTDIAFIQRYFI